MRFLRPLLQSAFVFCILAVLSSSAWGQTTASIRGTVTDQSGGVVAGAIVIWGARPWYGPRWNSAEAMRVLKFGVPLAIVYRERRSAALAEWKSLMA